MALFLPSRCGKMCLTAKHSRVGVGSQEEEWLREDGGAARLEVREEDRLNGGSATGWNMGGGAEPADPVEAALVV